MGALLLVSLVLPLLLAALLGSRLYRAVPMLTPLAALPALGVAVFPGIEIELPWLLLGMRLGVDQTGAPFLLLAGLLWTAAGIYARGYLSQDPERLRFHFFYLLTFAGNLGVILALDTASFYLFFALMTFAAYGLIIHDGSPEARRAGRVYLVLAVFGEVLLLVAVLYMVAAFGNVDLRELGPLLIQVPQRGLIVGLILTGFAIKMGTVPLHVWLPLAHPCAPTPASAVLSGIIIKAGLLGWLRFLPLGEMTLPGWGTLCLIMGLISAFYAVLAGLPQQRPKTVLAYSSISQMGLITALLGIGLAAPRDWPLILTILSLFALHHGLAKAALFLGVGVTGKGALWTGWVLALPALALAGAPLTSGALVKLLLKDISHLAPGEWVIWLPGLLTLSSLATGLLMARFLFLAWPVGPKSTLSVWLWLPWLILIIASTTLPWWWAADRLPESIHKVFIPDLWLASLWPVLGAAILALLTWGIWRVRRFSLHLPEGDILNLLPGRIEFSPRWVVKSYSSGWSFHPVASRELILLKQSERRLRFWELAGMLLLLLAIGLFLLSSV